MRGTHLRRQNAHHGRRRGASGADPPPTYAELAVRLGMAESTLRSHVTRLRARYREALRAEVRRTVKTEAHVDEELHELLRVLARG